VSSTPSRKRLPDRKVLGAPIGEWGVLAFVLVCAGVLLGRAATQTAATTLVLAAAGGALLPLAYTVKLWREGRLFLRSAKDIARNRKRIDRVSIPLGWLLGFGLIAFAGNPSVLAVVGGALLGLFPGLFANFLRLRRELWAD
jgi:O-antigen/teichoic acid export membrane protein